MAYQDVIKRDKRTYEKFLKELEKSSRTFNDKFKISDRLRLDEQQKGILEILLKDNETKNHRFESKDAPPSSYLNRQREQKRIQKENQILEKRIRAIGSRSCLSRTKMHKEPEKVPISFPNQVYKILKRPEWNDRWYDYDN